MIDGMMNDQEKIQKSMEEESVDSSITENNIAIAVELVSTFKTKSNDEDVLDDDDKVALILVGDETEDSKSHRL